MKPLFFLPLLLATMLSAQETLSYSTTTGIVQSTDTATMTFSWGHATITPGGINPYCVPSPTGCLFVRGSFTYAALPDGSAATLIDMRGLLTASPDGTVQTVSESGTGSDSFGRPIQVSAQYTMRLVRGWRTVAKQFVAGVFTVTYEESR